MLEVPGTKRIAGAKVERQRSAPLRNTSVDILPMGVDVILQAIAGIEKINEARTISNRSPKSSKGLETKQD